LMGGVTPMATVYTAGIRRYLYKPDQHEYFGYDVVAERVDNSSEYRVSFRALSLTPDDLRLPDPSLWMLLPSPVFPEPQILHIGDMISFDVFENPKTGQKIVDYIRLERRTCEDVSEDQAKAACLSGLLDDAGRELAGRIAKAEAKPDAAVQESVRRSQQSWEKYRDDACKLLPTRVKQLDCQLTLTRDRIHEVKTIY